jgi:DNA-directed RNA polymerase specialized sigma subunit
MDGMFTIRLPVSPASQHAQPAVQTGGTSQDSCGGSSDEVLMELVCNGDRETLALLFRRYARLVRGIAYRVLRDRSEADDLLQDIFLLVQRLCVNFDSSKGSAHSGFCK